MEPVGFVRDYFFAEQNESIAFIIIGLISICSAIGLMVYFRDQFRFQSVVTGACLAIALLGSLELITGTTIYFRSPSDIERVELLVTENVEGLVTEEIPRMEQVLKSFELYRWSEISVLIVGLLMFFILSKWPFFKGLGLGMFIQSSILLFLDYFAEVRADKYLSQLIELLNQ